MSLAYEDVWALGETHFGYHDLQYDAYSVVVADLSMCRPAVILDSGPLPRGRLTSVWAELYAIQRAIEFASCRGVQLVIWSDCQAVVRRLHRMLLGDSGQLNSPNADLWTLMADDVHGVCNVQTTKVAAHQEGCVATTPIEELGFLHTQLAVRVDARANERRGPDFWSLLARYTGACRIADEWNAMIQHVLRPGSCRILMHTGMVTSLFPRCCYGCGLQWRLGKVLRSGFLMLNGLLIMLFRLGMLARFMPGDGKSVLSTHYMPCSTSVLCNVPDGLERF